MTRIYLKSYWMQRIAARMCGRTVHIVRKRKKKTLLNLVIAAKCIAKVNAGNH